MTCEIASLVSGNLDVWTAAIERKAGAGRGGGKRISLYGIDRLRALILELAIRGKLIAQDTSDEPASGLMKRIEAERRRLISAGAMKRPAPLTHPEKWPFDLPETWAWTQLGLITNYGETDKANPGDASDETWVLELEDIEKGTSRLLERVRYASRKFQSQKNRFRIGDVIYGKLRPYLDKVIVADENGVCTTEMIPMRGYAGLEAAYLRLFLKTPFFIDLATNSTHGMNLPRLGTEKAREAPFALPPHAEQQRIVAKVDELMALCDSLEGESAAAMAAHQTLVEALLATLAASTDPDDLAANWARLEKNFDALFITEASVDALKQAIVELAVRGMLVPQDPAHTAASEVLQRTRAEKLRLAKAGKVGRDKPLRTIDLRDTPFALPYGWAWARFPEIGIFERGKSRHRPRNDPKLFNPPIYPLVQTGEVARADGLIQEFHSQYSELGLEQSKLWPEGTLCITIAANIADAAILGFDACFPDSVVGFIPYLPVTDTKYFLYFMRTAKADLLRFAPSTAQKNINLGILETVLIPLPPLEEMAIIVTKVDELMAICDRLKDQMIEAAGTQRYLADTIVEKVAA